MIPYRDVRDIVTTVEVVRPLSVPPRFRLHQTGRLLNWQVERDSATTFASRAEADSAIGSRRVKWLPSTIHDIAWDR